ncbi:MAG: flagellar hook-basal body complex protein FliE [Woeseiaceae bacterium]|nr:flagellar hook-basal body complex protein FliE [Woeseiaceae bacterium]
MNEISPEQLLSQIRTLRAELQSGLPATDGVRNTDGSAFGDSLAQAIRSVSDAQAASKQLKAEYAAEASDVSLAEVMIASQKADLSFRAMTEVRNKLITAYQDIMNMPV